MKTMDNKEYLKIRNYCVFKDLELNGVTLSLTRIKAHKNDVINEDWVLQEMYDQEIRREAYAKAVELLDGKTDFAVSEILDLEKIFRTKHVLNHHHLVLFKALSKEPSRQPFSVDHVIRKIELDEELNVAVIRLCEDLLSER